MKIKLLFFLLISSSIFLISNSNGITTVRNEDRTGSPISITACNQCHSGGNFSPTLEIKLKDLSGNLVSTYQPDSAYTIEFEFGGNNAVRYGYQATALLIEDNTIAGSLEASNSDSKIVSLNNIDYADHNGFVSSNTFILDWTAPSSGSGSVGFYASGIAADGNGFSSGDSPVTANALIVNELGNENPEEPENPENPEEPTNINDLEDRVFSFFPNPVVNSLNVNFKTDASFTIKIYNQNGKLIIFEKMNDKNASINLIDLTSGVYFVELIDSRNEKYISKIIKK